MSSRTLIHFLIIALFGLVLANCGGGGIAAIDDLSDAQLAALDDLEITQELNVEGDFEDEGVAVSDVREVSADDWGYADIAGVVVTLNPDDDGMLPIEGAHVILTRIHRHRLPDEPIYTLSNADGEYLFEHVPAGYYHISARKAGYTIHWSILMVSGRHPVKHKNFILHPIPDDLPTASLDGRVYGLVPPEDDDDDHTWEPVAGASVTLRHARLAIEPVEVTTDDAGEFSIESMVAGPWHAVIEAEGYKPAFSKVHVLPERENLLGVRLFPEDSPTGIFGRILTPSETEDGGRELIPVADATVTISTFDGEHSRTMQSGDDGHYAFFGLPVGIYKLSVDKDGFRSRRTLVRVGLNPHRLNVIIYGSDPPVTL